MDLSLSTSTAGERTVLAVAGEVDVYSAPQLRDRLTDLIDSGEHGLVVDLSGVTFLDSTGIGTLVAGLNHAAGLGGGLSLVCDQDRILKLFRITGLDGVFTIYSSIEAVGSAG